MNFKVIGLVRVPLDFEPPRLQHKIRVNISKLISVWRWLLRVVLLKQYLSFSIQPHTTLQRKISAHIKLQLLAYKTVH